MVIVREEQIEHSTFNSRANDNFDTLSDNTF